jgi:hypothetical protein
LLRCMPVESDPNGLVCEPSLACLEGVAARRMWAVELVLG